MATCQIFQSRIMYRKQEKLIKTFNIGIDNVKLGTYLKIQKIQASPHQMYQLFYRFSKKKNSVENKKKIPLFLISSLSNAGKTSRLRLTEASFVCATKSFFLQTMIQNVLIKKYYKIFYDKITFMAQWIKSNNMHIECSLFIFKQIRYNVKVPTFLLLRG